MGVEFEWEDAEPEKPVREFVRPEAVVYPPKAVGGRWLLEVVGIRGQGVARHWFGEMLPCLRYYWKVLADPTVTLLKPRGATDER